MVGYKFMDIVHGRRTDVKRIYDNDKHIGTIVGPGFKNPTQS
jgi:hypothetical protein